MPWGRTDWRAGAPVSSVRMSSCRSRRCTAKAAAHGATVEQDCTRLDAGAAAPNGRASFAGSAPEMDKLMASYGNPFPAMIRNGAVTSMAIEDGIGPQAPRLNRPGALL